MKIRSLEVDNHPILGTFTFEFENDKPTTLLVGQNGSGKTRFMELLHTLLDRGFRVWEIPDWQNAATSRIKLSIQLNNDECLNLADIRLNNGQVVNQDLGSGDLYFEATQKTSSWEDFDVFMLNHDGNGYMQLPRDFKLSLASEKPFAKALRSKSRYSSVQINFEYKPVTSFAEIVDNDEKIQTKSTPEVADEINKLLVATFNKDNSYLGEESRKGNAHPDFKGDFDRFKDSYEQLFQSKLIQTVEQDGADNKIVILDKNTGKTFGIDGLSSGEQQVVYRVGYLLRHLNIRNGGVVFIDEPELSLHPEWQAGYIQFLHSIFGNNLQFVIATDLPGDCRTT